MTPLLRELVIEPIAVSASSTRTSRPRCASARATASPMTPAPTTMISTFSMEQLKSVRGFSNGRRSDRLCQFLNHAIDILLIHERMERNTEHRFLQKLAVDHQPRFFFSRSRAGEALALPVGDDQVGE